MFPNCHSFNPAAYGDEKAATVAEAAANGDEKAGTVAAANAWRREGSSNSNSLWR